MMQYGKLKGKRSHIPKQNTVFDYLKKHYEMKGALSSQNYVLCEIKPNKIVKAVILSSRYSKHISTLEKLDQSSYDYYIHYEDYDRRNDEWVSYHRLTLTHEKVVQQKINDKNSKNGSYEENQGLTVNDIQAHERNTRIKLIPQIQLGKYKTKTWYYSYFPPFFHHIECLYFCDFCLNYYSAPIELKYHSQKCPLYHPPGDQIYRDQNEKIAIFQVDGNKNEGYCANLASLAKFFLDHKVIGINFHMFSFYVLCQIIDNQYHLVGYFSKQKNSEYNLSCILVLPFYQRKGYGKLLITFSYELTLLERKTGSPEKPLSDLGRQTYLSWWRQRIIDYLLENKEKSEGMNLQKMAKETGIYIKDVIWTMEETNMIKIVNEQIYLNMDQNYLKEVYKRAGMPSKKIIKNNIHWVAPFSKQI